MDKAQIIGILKDIAVFLELKGENSFKIRAYQSGARALERLEENFDTIVQEGKIASLQGIGQALALKIETLYHEGHLPFYDNLKSFNRPWFNWFLEIPGLGGKKVKHIHDALGIETIEALKVAANQVQLKHWMVLGLNQLKKFSQELRIEKHTGNVICGGVCEDLFKI